LVQAKPGTTDEMSNSKPISTDNIFIDSSPIRGEVQTPK
jgi:hypothetical protein